MNDLDFTLSSKERESNYIFQSLTGLQSAKEVRLYNFEKSFQNKYNQIRTLIVGEKMKIQKSSIKKNTVIGVLEILFAGGLFAYLGYDVLRGSISLGLFILYLQGTQRLQTISKGFFQSLLQLFQLRLFVKDLHAFLNLSENKNINPSIQELEINSLSIRNLSFRYPGNTIHTLENINLNAQKGKIIALVGENGSGKSTLVKLLAGLYNPAPDSIFVNDNDLLSVPKPVWYRQSAVLFQDFEKYFFEVDKNIHFDLNESNNLRKESIAAASQSLAHEFILNLSKQYDTRLGNLYEGSEQLSGGQWQKLALARIFFKDRPVVILDEPSSALDAFAELSLYENIKNSFSNKIVIIVSHRLYNLKIADYIYVLSHGKITEEGNFNDLIQQNGLFYSMYEKQKI
jgi:ATP-binding cassette subfamily B protein